MGKRRTKKQKINARHNYAIGISNEGGSVSFSHTVNRQNKKTLDRPSDKTPNPKKTNVMADSYNLASIKKDLIKSLIISSLILALEMMIYFYSRS